MSSFSNFLKEAVKKSSSSIDDLTFSNIKNFRLMWDTFSTEIATLETELDKVKEQNILWFSNFEKIHENNIKLLKKYEPTKLEEYKTIYRKFLMNSPKGNKPTTESKLIDSLEAQIRDFKTRTEFQVRTNINLNQEIFRLKNLLRKREINTV